MRPQKGSLGDMSLTMLLDQATLDKVADIAALHEMSSEEWLRRTICTQLNTAQAKFIKRAKSSQKATSQAPMDAYLPEGVDPFSSVDPHARLSFEEIQLRMRFAGTPSLLRDAEA